MADNSRALCLVAAAKFFFQNSDFLDSDEESELEALGKMLGESHRHEKESDSEPEDPDYFDLIPHLNDSTFKSQFRISRSNFQHLLDNLAPLITRDVSLPGRRTTDPAKQLLMVLSLLATTESMRVVAEKFEVNKSGVERSFQRLVAALNIDSIKNYYIRWPTTDDIYLKETVEGFQTKAGFPGVIGVVDACHIPIKPPKPAEPFYNRKKVASMILQACCDDKLRFTHCFTGYPGSVPDSFVLEESELGDHPELFPEDSHILGDIAYPARNWILTPFRNDGYLNEKQKVYNIKHQKTSRLIDMAFALYKNRFKKYQNLDMTKSELIAPTIIAGCVLHNAALWDNDDFGEFLPFQPVNEEDVDASSHDDMEGIRKRLRLANYLYQ